MKKSLAYAKKLGRESAIETGWETPDEPLPEDHVRLREWYSPDPSDWPEIESAYFDGWKAAAAEVSK